MNRFFRMNWPDFDPRMVDAIQKRIFKAFEDELGVQQPRQHQRGVFPPVNISESDTGYLLECELPGVPKDGIDLKVAGNKLTLSGNVLDDKLENMSYHRREREHGSFARTFTLPEDADTDQVNARFNEGVLQITVAKEEKSLPRKITISVG
jgi:HSP20 family protein